MKDDFLNKEDKELPEEELNKKLAWTIVSKLNPVFAKKKLFMFEFEKLSYNKEYFKKMYDIYLKESDK